MSRLLHDIQCLAPTNWEELAAAARFLTGVYAMSFRHEAMLLSALDGTHDLDSLVASFLLRDFAADGDHAYAIALGARASAMDGRHGGFEGRKELITRMVEARASGAIIDGFVKTARTITVTNTLFKDDRSIALTEARHHAVQDLFDGTLKRIEAHDRLLKPFRPATETVLQIVAGELGHLSPSLRETIRRVMAFKPGPS